MNQVSTITDSRLPALKEKKFDCEAESLKVVEEIVKDVPEDEILVKGTIFTQELSFQLTFPLSQGIFGKAAL